MLNYYQTEKLSKVFSIGLGDGRNDIEMLELVDYSIVIKSHKGTHLDLNKVELVYKSESKGPQGWNEEVLRFLENYSLLKR